MVTMETVRASTEGCITGAEMSQGGEKKKPTKENTKETKKKASGKAEEMQTAGEGGERKLMSRSSVLQEDREDIYQLPTLYILTVQRYKGETCEGQFHGEGLACFEGGHMYKGKFSKGLMDGQGVFVWASGQKYEGDFVCNVPMGRGTYTWPDGSSYKGEVYNGKRHGSGTYQSANNVLSYIGQWDQGKRHGKGEEYYNQEKTSWYKGDWVKNKREGWGVRCYPSGNIYSGEWKNNVIHGEGTMKWRGEEYAGMWQNGAQNGKGTHTWILWRSDGSRYVRSNQYTGNFVQGQRHDWGTFYYAGGAIYEGEWRNNEKHGKSKFTSEDGRVFKGEFQNDKMLEHNPNGTQTSLFGSTSSILGPDMTLNIERLLKEIPERTHSTERKQMEFAVLWKCSELRTIYSFYSRLGRPPSPDNTYMLSRLQLWRLLKDCNIHHHGISLTQIDHIIRDGDTTEEIHSLFTPMLFRELLSCLVAVAYHIYHKDIASQRNLLAECFSKLLTDNILPNAMNVKGFVFRQPGCLLVVMNNAQKCWEIYQANCKVRTTPKSDQTMTCRQLLWMFKDFHLLDKNLTTARLMEIITAENPDPSNWSSCLDLEIKFPEFFEALLGAAEVKGQRVPQLMEDKCLSRTDAEARRDLPETMASSDSEEMSADKIEESQVDDIPQSAEKHRSKGKLMKAQSRKLEHWSQTVHQFFNHFLFPAFEHHQLVSVNVREEKLRQEAQQRARGKEHQEADN